MHRFPLVFPHPTSENFLSTGSDKLRNGSSEKEPREGIMSCGHAKQQAQMGRLGRKNCWKVLQVKRGEDR